MPEIRHILIPTDGSEHSLKAGAFGGDMARSLGARVSILLVQDERSVVAEAWNAAVGQTGQGAVAEARESMEKAAEERELAETRSAVGDVATGLDIVQVWGHPATEICDYAEQNGVDLIVMGSHGRSALKRAILGSVSHAVVNSAACSVTIVR